MCEQNNQPDIVIPENAGDNLQLVSREEFEDLRKGHKSQKTIVNWTFGFIIAILIAVFLSFVGFIIDSYRFHSDVTKEYSKKLDEFNNYKKNLTIDSLKSEIKEIKKENAKIKLLIENQEGENDTLPTTAPQKP